MENITLPIIAIIISSLSPIVAILIYRRNKEHIKEIDSENKEFLQKLHNDKMRQSNVNNVVNKYFELTKSLKDTGISALIKAGLSNLQTENEAKQAIGNISSSVAKHPLGRYQHDIEQVGILKVFKSINLEILKNPGLDKVLSELKLH